MRWTCSASTSPDSDSSTPVHRPAGSPIARSSAALREVVAVDVGHGQLHERLRADDRVVNIERQNIRAVTPELIGGLVDGAVGDLSFISLRLVIAPLVAVCQPGAFMVLLVKPQFEAGRAEVEPRPRRRHRPGGPRPSPRRGRRGAAVTPDATSSGGRPRRSPAPTATSSSSSTPSRRRPSPAGCRDADAADPRRPSRTRRGTRPMRCRSPSGVGRADIEFWMPVHDATNSIWRTMERSDRPPRPMSW